jgi:hypothetical protein
MILLPEGYAGNNGISNATPEMSPLLRPSAFETPEKSLMKRTITDLDSEMDNILQNTSITEDEKLKLYSQALRQRMAFQNQLTVQAPIKVEINGKEKLPLHMEKMALDIISGVPVTAQVKARRIIDMMKSHPNVISWNDKWELVHEGTPVQGTNIVDLVNDMVREKKNFDPPGASTLLQGLKKINFPQTYIGNETRRRQMRGISTTTPTKVPASPSLAIAGPSGVKRKTATPGKIKKSYILHGWKHPY